MEKRNSKTADELEEIADKVVGLLKKEELPVWQAQEALRYAIRKTEWQVLK